MNLAPDSPLVKPQFYCRYCGQWKVEIDRMPITLYRGSYVCAACEDRRVAALAKIKAQNKRWHDG
jgi:transcription elongation factor Elf1